jgi:hypothetical protein
MMTDSSNEEMMSSRPPISNKITQYESKAGAFAKGVPEKVTSMSSGWITSDAIRSEEI